MSDKSFITKFFTYIKTCKHTRKTPKNVKTYTHKHIEQEKGVE